MADEEKTEAPTGKKLGDARNKGMVARSTDLNSAIMLLSAAFILRFLGPKLSQEMLSIMRECLMGISSYATIPEDLYKRSWQSYFFLLRILMPIVGTLLIVGMISNFAQVGFMWSLESLGPHFGRIFGFSGLKKMFSPQTLVELLKSVLKMFVVGFVAYSVMMSHFHEYLILADQSLSQIIKMLFDVSYEIIWKSTLTLLVIGIADIIYLKKKFMKDLRMSKQEVKDEARSSDGDPAIKGKIRALRQQMFKNMMMKEVPRATVIITNPTFIALAIRYEQGVDTAPRVLAKGKRLIAERIRNVARENDIPIVEDKPLARSLYDFAEVGEDIPAEFFAAMAEILAYVYGLKNQK